VSVERDGRVREIQVKSPTPNSRWIWGAFKLRGRVLRELHGLWREAGRGDEYFGTLVNAYLARGGTAIGVQAGRGYVDVGTLNGYREATRLLEAVKLVSKLTEQSPRDGEPSSRRPVEQRSVS
jgi:hypothetical protein